MWAVSSAHPVKWSSLTSSIRKQIKCEYPKRRKPRTSRPQTSNDEHLDNQHHSTGALPQDSGNPQQEDAKPGLPAAQFLDPFIFSEARLEVTKPTVAIPARIADAVGSATDVRAASVAFFISVHKWMPILCKKQFHANVLSGLSNRRAEFFLLTLSMKLSASHVRTAQNELYFMAKQFHCDLQTSGILSIEVLQATILIAIYELGHAIYPAAFLSIGSCARYATALGIDKTSRFLSAIDLPAVEEEECRRCWWSILILDRCVV